MSGVFFFMSCVPLVSIAYIGQKRGADITGTRVREGHHVGPGN